MIKFKKILASLCSLAMLTTVFVVPASAGEQSQTPLMTISSDLKLTDVADGKQIVINFDTDVDTILGAAMNVQVPEALEPYIASYSFSSDLAATVNQPSAITTGRNDVGRYLTTSINAKTSPNEIQTNGKIGSLSIVLKEGYASLPTADRTLVIGGEFKANNRYTAANVNTNGKTYYAYNANTSDTTFDIAANKNYWNLDPTAKGNYIVLPADINWVPATLYDEYSSDIDNSTAVAYTVDITGNGKEYDTLTWKVTANGETKGCHVPAVIGGSGNYKFGIAIGGLTADDFADTANTGVWAAADKQGKVN